MIMMEINNKIINNILPEDILDAALNMKKYTAIEYNVDKFLIL